MMRTLEMEERISVRSDMKTEVRVVDTGEGLTLAMVEYSPFGDVVAADTEFLTATSLSSLRDLLSSSVDACAKPVILLRDLI